MSFEFKLCYMGQFEWPPDPHNTTDGAEDTVDRIRELAEAKAEARRRVEDILASPDNSREIVRAGMAALAEFARLGAALAKAEADMELRAGGMDVQHSAPIMVGSN